VVIRSRKAKDKQHNGQNKMDKRTYEDPQTEEQTTQWSKENN
jgi:hypothetical protein